MTTHIVEGYISEIGPYRQTDTNEWTFSHIKVQTSELDFVIIKKLIVDNNLEPSIRAGRNIKIATWNIWDRNYGCAIQFGENGENIIKADVKSIRNLIVAVMLVFVWVLSFIIPTSIQDYLPILLLPAVGGFGCIGYKYWRWDRYAQAFYDKFSQTNKNVKNTVIP